jgi:phospholipid/cholesterol/gamma-HCH transport system ATP-binding protein
MDCVKLINGRIIMLIDGVNYAEGTYSKLASSTDKQVKAFFE